MRTMCPAPRCFSEPVSPASYSDRSALVSPRATAYFAANGETEVERSAMKRAILIVLCTMLLSAGVSAQDMVPVPFSIYAGGGVSFPIEPDTLFTQQTSTGYHGLLGVGYKFMPLLEGVLKAEYNTFSGDLDAGLDGGDWSMILVGIGVRGGLGVPTASYRPFAFGGFGLAWTERDEVLSADTVAVPSFDRETSVYFDVGGGLEFGLAPKVQLFLQGRYVYISTDNEPTSFIPVTLGLKFF
ncbi:outer membrane beta-barrel protein [candidate division GN15 bacterium]|nr:outer membrane beta-barrel protein [candidate division GN15 bacterium]